MSRYSILVAVLVVLILGMVVADMEPEVRVTRMPELQSCSCDSAYRCMTDEDYMNLVILFSVAEDPFVLRGAP